MKLVRLLVLLALSTWSVAAFASHRAICEYRTDLIDISNTPTLNAQSKSNSGGENTFVQLATFKILEATKVDGSYVGCEGQVGKTIRLVLKNAEAKFVQKVDQRGKSVNIRYDHASGQTSGGGFSVTETWMLMKSG